MKKLRLTPLNIVTALSLALFIVLLFQPKTDGPRHIDVSIFYKFLLGGLVIVCFICDLIFRFALKDLKKIWIVESILVVITVILFLILQK